MQLKYFCNNFALVCWVNLLLVMRPFAARGSRNISAKLAAGRIASKVVPRTAAARRGAEAEAGTEAEAEAEAVTGTGRVWRPLYGKRI